MAKKGYKPDPELLKFYEVEVIRKALETRLRDTYRDMPEEEVKKLARFYAFAAHDIINGKPEQEKKKG